MLCDDCKKKPDILGEKDFTCYVCRKEKTTKSTYKNGICEDCSDVFLVCEDCGKSLFKI